MKPRNLFILLLLFLLFTNACSAVTVSASPAMTTPTLRYSYSQAQIAKPTYTPTPLPAEPVATVTPVVEETSSEPVTATEAVAQAVIVDVPEVSNTVNSGGVEAAPASYGGGKYVLVDISEQHMYVYEGEYLIYSFVASTGMNNATRIGVFSVLNKIPNAYGATWNIWMPNWMGIYWAGSLQNGIHALPILPNGGTLWAGYLGTPISYGCVVLGSYEAQVLYDWAEVGVPVEIQW